MYINPSGPKLHVVQVVRPLPQRSKRPITYFHKSCSQVASSTTQIPCTQLWGAWTVRFRQRCQWELRQLKLSELCVKRLHRPWRFSQPDETYRRWTQSCITLGMWGLISKWLYAHTYIYIYIYFFFSLYIYERSCRMYLSVNSIVTGPQRIWYTGSPERPVTIGWELGM